MKKEREKEKTRKTRKREAKREGACATKRGIMNMSIINEFCSLFVLTIRFVLCLSPKQKAVSSSTSK